MYMINSFAAQSILTMTELSEGTVVENRNTMQDETSVSEKENVCENNNKVKENGHHNNGKLKGIGENMREEEEESLTERRAVRVKTYKNLTVISLGFLFLFTAFQALQNLQSSIHEDKNLGFTSLVVIYASLLTSCMFVPPLLIGKLGCKYTVMLAMCGYVLYTVSMFYPRYWTVIPASALLGLCGAPLWSAKCAYITSSGIRYGRVNDVDEDHLITQFFGIFFLIFQTGQIWGNLVSYLVLKPSGGHLNMTQVDIRMTCGNNYCPSTSLTSQQNTSKSTVTTLMAIYLGFGCMAIAVIFFFLDKIKVIGENQQKGFCSLFVATLHHLKNKKMLLLIPLTMFSGLEQGFVFGDFTKAFVTCALGIEKVGLIMICFGAVDAIFSLLLSKIVEFTGRPVMMAVASCINLGLLVAFLVWTPNAQQPWVYYVGASLWGFADAVWQTQVNAFYGVLFPTNQEAAFSNYRLWESLGFVISFTYGNLLCIRAKIYILLAFLVVGILLYYVIEWLRGKEEKTRYGVQSGGEREDDAL